MIFSLQDAFTANTMYDHFPIVHKKIGFISGCFDLFHYYHVKLLERCKRECDVLIVGVNSDKSIQRYKGEKRPIFTEDHRLLIVEQSKYVTVAAIIDEPLRDIELLIKTFSVNVVFSNGQFGDKLIGKKFVDNCVVIPDIEPLSSTTAFIKKAQDLS